MTLINSDAAELTDMNTPSGQFAIVRQVPDSFNQCIKPDGEAVIDVSLARDQHAAYCAALEAAGLELIRLEPDERYPDCCFVEDTTMVAGDLAVMLPIGASSRVGEEVEVEKSLRPYKLIKRIKPPASMDGGDILKIENRMYIGLSQRTNRRAISELNSLISLQGYEAIPVPLDKVLHLKSACSYVGSGQVVISPGCFDDRILSEYNKIEVPDPEAYSANCLAINGTVLISKGFPQTKNRIESAGFKTVELEMSEFRKAWGSLTCLSVIF
jgi:dimethylargininase